MKKIVVFLGIWSVLLFMPHQIMAAQKADPKLNSQSKLKPELVIDHPVFVFNPVPEGEHVSHIFMLKNKGDASVKITEVRPP